MAKNYKIIYFPITERTSSVKNAAKSENLSCKNNII